MWFVVCSFAYMLLCRGGIHGSLREGMVSGGEWWEIAFTLHTQMQYGGNLRLLGENPLPIRPVCNTGLVPCYFVNAWLPWEFIWQSISPVGHQPGLDPSLPRALTCPLARFGHWCCLCSTLGLRLITSVLSGHYIKWKFRCKNIALVNVSFSHLIN